MVYRVTESQELRLEQDVIRAQERCTSYPQSIDANRPVGRCHLCFGCKKEYEEYVDTGKLQSFPINCFLSADIQTFNMAKEAGLTEIESAYVGMGLNAAEWALVEFGWKARWYQEEVLSCSSQFKVLRIGRRAGKTAALAIASLHAAATRPKVKCLIITPFQEHTELVFGMIDALLEESTTMKSMIKRYVRSPSHTMEFTNGSTIKSLTAGVKTGSKASKVRGQDADFLAIDECDLLSKDDIESVMAIMASHPRVQLWISGTPTGKREYFFKWSSDPSHNFKTFHFPSSVAPTWTPEIEKWFRNTYSISGYTAEFDADFPVLKEGVFPPKLVDRATQDYDMQTLHKRSGWIYIIGVDWNETDTGAQIAVVGFNPGDQKFWLVRKVVVSREEFTQLKAVDKIIELNTTWNPTFIYVDYGFGHCVGPDTLIQTEDGTYQIQDLHIGTRVLTAAGDYKEVLGKVTSPAKLSYKVRPIKCLETVVSYCHPFLTLRTKDRFNDESFNEADLKWRTCEEVDPTRDFVAIVKTKHQRPSNTVVDVMSFLPVESFECDDTHVWSKFGYKTDFPTSRYLDIQGEHFLRALGWYLSEGSATDNSIEFSQAVGNHSEEFQSLITSLTFLFPNQVTTSTKTTHNVKHKDQVRVTVSGKYVAALFIHYGGKGCANKRLHSSLLGLDLGVCVNALFLGDGHVSRNHNNTTLHLAMTSFHLVSQIRQVLIDQGILPSLYLLPSRDNNLPQLRIDISGNSTEMDRFSKFIHRQLPNPKRVDRRKSVETPNYFLVPFAVFEEIGEVSGLVDIEVQDAHSFVGNGFCLHNTNIELLHNHGKNYPKTGLLTKVVGVHMGGKVKINDPYLGETKKDVKPLVVSLSLRRFENDQIVLPQSENKSEGTEGLVNQILDYKVLRYTNEGRPIYSQDNDHILTSWMLALYGFWLQHTDLVNGSLVSRIGHISGDSKSSNQSKVEYPFSVITVELTKESIKEKREEEKRIHNITSRGFDTPHNKGVISDAINAVFHKPSVVSKKVDYFARKSPPKRRTF